jgi:hypothetical protein
MTDDHDDHDHDQDHDDSDQATTITIDTQLGNQPAPTPDHPNRSAIRG